MNHDFSHIRRYRRPSLWRKFLWWAGGHLTICEVVLIAAAIFFAVAIADAARAGGW